MGKEEMEIRMDRKNRIYELLLSAAEKSFKELFEEHKEHYYHCSLIMMDVATPCITAMSEESLGKLLDETFNDSQEREENLTNYKWVYAESPYLGFGYDKYFGEVNQLFYTDLSDELSDDEYGSRVNDWLYIMRDVISTLKNNGIFKDSCNADVFLNAEMQPPETSINLENARYLNSDEVFDLWYKDNKEEYE